MTFFKFLHIGFSPSDSFGRTFALGRGVLEEIIGAFYFLERVSWKLICSFPGFMGCYHSLGDS